MTVDMEEFGDSVIWKKAAEKMDMDVAYRKIREFLERFDIPATFFILGTFAEDHRDIVRSIRESGDEVASHFYSHQNLYLLSEDEIRSGIQRSRKVLGRTDGFRAPIYSMHRGIARILSEEGFRYDSSVFPSIFYPHPSIRNVERELRISSERKKGCPYRIGDLWEVPLTVFPSYIGLPVTGTTIRVYGGVIASLLRFYSGELFVLNVHPFEFLRPPRVKGAPWWFSFNSGEKFVGRLSSIVGKLKEKTKFATISSALGCKG